MQSGYSMEKPPHGNGGDTTGFPSINFLMSNWSKAVRKSNVYTKKDLIADVAGTTKTSKRKSRVMVNAFMDTVKEAMKKNDKVALVGFGTFGVKERKARKGVNPKTLKAITIPKKKAVFFKPGKELRDAVAKK